jgi:hypothetical protein
MIEVRIEGLGPLLETLKALPPEIVSKRGGPVRAGLRKAAVVVQKEYQGNIDRIATEGETNESTGTLRRAVIVSRRKPGNFKGERFWLRVKRGAKNPDGVPANTVGGVLEFGDQRVPAKAPMRRAWEAKKQQALATFLSETPKAIDAAVKRARKGR